MPIVLKGQPAGEFWYFDAIIGFPVAFGIIKRSLGWDIEKCPFLVNVGQWYTL